MSGGLEDGKRTQPWEMMREVSAGEWNPYQKGPQNWTGWTAMDYMHPVDTSQSMGQWDMVNVTQKQPIDVYNWTGPQQYDDKSQWQQDIWKGKAAEKCWHQQEGQSRGMGTKGYRILMDGKEQQSIFENKAYPMQEMGGTHHAQWKGGPDGSKDHQKTNLMGQAMWIQEPDE